MACYLNNEAVVQTVNQKDKFNGSLQLDIGTGEDETYVISFWGDGSLIQVGEHLLYKAAISAGQIIRYEFEIGDSLDNINNFYAIVSPVSDSKNTGIEKMPTIILSDDELINEQNNETTDEVSTDEVDSNLTQEYFDVYEYGDTIYKAYGSSDNYGVINRIEKIDLDSGDTLATYNITKTAIGVNNVNILGDGAIVSYSKDNEINDSIIILNNKLEVLYDGLGDEFFSDYEVQGNANYLYISSDEVIAVSLDNDALVSKNISTGKESVIFDLSGLDICVRQLFYLEGKIIFDGTYNNDSEHAFTYVVDTNTGDYKMLDGLITNELSADGSTCLLHEYVDAFSEDKPYVYLYDIQAGNLLKVDLDSSDETQEADMSYYGDRVITYTNSSSTDSPYVTIKCYVDGTSKNLLVLEDTIGINYVKQVKDGIVIYIDNVNSKEYKWED